MAGDDDEIIVTIEPELDETLGTGDADVKVIEGRANEDPALDLKNQFTKMQGDLTTANQRITSAETEAQRTQRLLDEERVRNKHLETEVIDTRKSTVEQGITAATAEADAAQADYERAFADGDAAAAARAQRRMSQAEGRISRLTEAKEDLAATKPAPRKVEEQPRRAAPSSDPVEEYVKGRTPTTAAWIRAHPDFVTDARKNAKLTGAHFDAVGEGLTVDTPEYFAHVEKFLGLKVEAKPGAAQQQQRRPSAPTAPGADVGGRNGAPSTVKLTRSEATAATDGTIVWNYDDPSGKNKFKKGDPIGHSEFARRKLAMEREGRYDRTYTES